MTTRRVGHVEVGPDRIVYDDVAGPSTRGTVVLVHGSGGNRATWWPVLASLVSAELRVISLDVRGSGRSTDHVAQLGPRQVAVDLEALRRDAGIEQWHVVGHSMGGWHALRYAVEHPSSTTGVTCLSSIGGVMTTEATAWFAEFAKLAAGWSAASDPFQSQSLGEEWCTAHPGEAYLYQLLRELNPDPVRGVPGEDIATSALSTEEVGVLASLDVHFVTGEHDPYAPPAVVRSCAETAGARFTEIAGGGHTVFWQQPEVLATTVG